MLGQGMLKIIAALVTVQWAYYARTVRSAALVEKRKEYIEAARCLALAPSRIVFRHLLPNCLPPLIVVATVQVAAAIALEATLSFLGLGLPITEPSLGLLIANGYQYLLSGKYWISFFPGIALLLTIVSINLVADQLRDVAQSEAAAMTDARVERRRPAHPFLHQGGRRQGGRRRELQRRARRGAGPGRRIGLGQVDDRILDHGPGRSRRAASSPAGYCIDGRRPRGAGVGSDASVARQPHRDDLPGSDDDAEPGAAHRHADGRGDPARTSACRSDAAAGARASTLVQVGIASPDERLAAYPHQFSGGMRQRVAIAIALLNVPDVIIADEPTTALDVTIQGQILFEMQKLTRETGAALIWITHDLSVIAGLADRVCVMYAGRIVEQGTTADVLGAPRHPYTQGLLDSVPGQAPGAQASAQYTGHDAVAAGYRPGLRVPRTLRLRDRGLRANAGDDADPVRTSTRCAAFTRCPRPIYSLRPRTGRVDEAGDRRRASAGSGRSADLARRWRAACGPRRRGDGHSRPSAATGSNHASALTFGALLALRGGQAAAAL